MLTLYIHSGHTPKCDLSLHIISLYWYIVVYWRNILHYTNLLLHNGMACVKCLSLFILHCAFQFTLPNTDQFFSEVTDHQTKRQQFWSRPTSTNYPVPMMYFYQDFLTYALTAVKNAFYGSRPHFEPRARISPRTSAILTDHFVASLSPFRHVDGYWLCLCCNTFFPLSS